MLEDLPLFPDKPMDRLGCSRIQGLTARQRSLCATHPQLMVTTIKGVNVSYRNP